MECPVCYDSFSKDVTIPKILNKCGHTICQACLNNYVKSSSACKIKCPFCKIEYSVNEVNSSPTNFYILNMLNEKEKCSIQHKKNIPSRSCSMHMSTHMDFFCKTDQTYLCGKCLLSGEHMNHDIAHVEDEVEGYKKKLVQSIKNLDHKNEKIGKTKDRFEKNLQEYQTLTKQVIVHLDKKFNEVLNMIVKRREELIESFIQSTASMNEYLKEKVGFFSKLQDSLNEHIAESKETKRKLNTPGFDLRSLEPLKEKKILDEMSENIAKEFKLDLKMRKGSFEDIFERIEEIKLNFVQSPFFVFKDNLMNEFLESYAQMVSFNFSLPNELKLENDLFFGVSNNHYEKVKINSKTHTSYDTAIEIENEGEKGNNNPTKLFNKEAPFNFNKNQLLDITNLNNNQLSPLNTVPNNIQTIDLNNIIGNNIRDPFQEFQIAETTICLLGQNDKALYLSENGICELVSLDIEVLPPEEKKGSVLKNFAACAFLERNKVLYTGGGPSKDVYLLEFKSKKNVVATSLSKMIKKRCWHGALYIRPYLYVFGGYDGVNRLKECERLNLQGTSHNFESVASMNEARSLFGYTLCKDNFIYVVGGVSASVKSTCTDSIEVFSTLENKWNLLQFRLPQRLCGISCIYFEEEEKLRIFGGSDNFKKNSKSVFELNTKDHVISEVGSMDSRKNMNNKVFKKNHFLYLVGGNTDNEYEIWNFATQAKKKLVFNYGSALKGDLNNFCGFVL